MKFNTLQFNFLLNNGININVMKNSQVKVSVLSIAAGLLLISILLLTIIMPGVYYKSLPNENNPGSIIGISMVIIFRLLLVIWYISIIKKNRLDSEKRKTAYIVIGILLIILGLISLDGAFAFLDNKNTLYISYLMFTSVICDLIASILTFTAIFFKSQNLKE